MVRSLHAINHCTTPGQFCDEIVNMKCSCREILSFKRHQNGNADFAALLVVSVVSSNNQLCKERRQTTECLAG